VILKVEDYPGLPRDLDLDKTEDIPFYYKKMKAVAGNKSKNSVIAGKIAKIIEENYPEYLV